MMGLILVELFVDLCVAVILLVVAARLTPEAAIERTGWIVITWVALFSVYAWFVP